MVRWAGQGTVFATERPWFLRYVVEANASVAAGPADRAWSGSALGAGSGVQR